MRSFVIRCSRRDTVFREHVSNELNGTDAVCGSVMKHKQNFRAVARVANGNAQPGLRP